MQPLYSACLVSSPVVESNGELRTDGTERLLGILEVQPASLRGLHDVQTFVSEHLEAMACDTGVDAANRRAAAMLFGKYRSSCDH